MWAFFERLLDSSMFSPHGICLLWEPELIWLHVGSDALIAMAYFSIPIALAIFVSKRRDLKFGWVYWAFGVFILACGFTHVLSIYTLWVPIYGIEGLVKAATAIASVFTAGMLWPLLPELLTITSPFELRRVRAALEEEEMKGRGAERMLAQFQETQRALRESMARLTAVVETAVDGFILIDSRGRILLFNPACERLFGYRADEVFQENVKLLMPRTYSLHHDDYLRNFLRSGERKIIGIGREVVGRRKDGSTFPMDLSVGEAKQDGESIFVGIIHDLTERKLTERQLQQAQKMEMVGQLSGGIAHDFNNLLTVIVGNAEHLSEQLKSRLDLRQLADDICQAGERGAELARRLLAFSRRQLLRPRAIDCHELIASTCKLLKRTLRENIEVTTAFNIDAIFAFADSSQLESAVLNLALNAQDAMAAGGRLTISTGIASLDDDDQGVHPDIESGEYAMIAVTDNGEGMAPDVAARAFEPFFTTKEVGKGSGLGLSMVYGFVKQSNGHVSIYSEPGLGTTVRIYLPNVTPNASRSSSQPAADEEALPRGNETILVVEDDPFVRSSVILKVESLGYKVVLAVDGREAVMKLRTNPEIDMLFTDIVMPGGMSGWEVAELAQQMRPGLPTVFTSGYALEALVDQGRAPMKSIVLTKPYRKAELAHRLREALAATSLAS
ncbi:MAG TPA: PAS domain S-box protein [Bradyrhizobium sp.]|nr:PAS domain S-box protein [Bradyrhizobium sp.]